MSIFLEVAKLVMTEKVDKIFNASLAADNSLKNAALSIFGKGRNPNLSVEKRVALKSQLQPAIDGVGNTQGDLQTLTHLKQLIQDSLQKVGAKSHRYNYSSGETETSLINLQALLQSIFDKLSKLNLLDIPHDADKLNSFRYHVAIYCAKILADEYDLTFFSQLARHPHLSKKIAFVNEQEELVIRALNECTADLDVLTLNHPRYEEVKRKFITREVEELRKQNIQLNESHKIISLLGLPILNPDDGSLEKLCLTAVINEINGLSQPKIIQQTLNATLSPVKAPYTSCDIESDDEYLDSHISSPISAAAHSNVSTPQHQSSASASP